MDRFFEIFGEGGINFITNNLNTAILKVKSLQINGFDPLVDVNIYYSDVTEITGNELNMRNEFLLNSLSKSFSCEVTYGGTIFSREDLIRYFEGYKLNPDVFKYI